MDNQEPTRELAAKAREGDRGAFDRLAEIHRRRLSAFIRARAGAGLRRDPGLEDLLQETFLRAFRSIDRFEWRDGDSFFRWLAGIAEHLIWNAAEKGGREKIRLPRDVPAAGASPSQAARREERFERLEKALAGLSPDHRLAIRLARIEGLKIREIAERMGRSPDAVKKLLARGLAELKRSFGETDSFHLPDRSLEDGGDRDGRR